jgi:hypothetical protein
MRATARAICASRCPLKPVGVAVELAEVREPGVSSFNGPAQTEGEWLFLEHPASVAVFYEREGFTNADGSRGGGYGKGRLGVHHPHHPTP